MGSRADIITFQAFRDMVMGRLVPFWLPTWHHDLFLATDVSATSATALLRNSNYTRYFFDPATTWRRYVAFIKIGAGLQFIRRIDFAEETAPGIETITLDSGVPSLITKGEWMLSFLTLCRLDSDTVEMHWHSPTLAEATIMVRELPLEMP
jgi:hypothetical protein